MKTAAILAFFIAIVLLLAFAFPDRLFSPGPTAKGHASIAKQCFACHRPFGGVPATQCTSCHKPESIGIRSVAGRPLPVRSESVRFHKGVSGNSCIRCHAGHRSGVSKTTARPFQHAALSRELQADCIRCHSGARPDDQLHRAVAKRNCGACHVTGSWKGARFEHGKLDGRAQAQCSACHRRDQPGDRLHAGAGANCSACHATTGWKPANFSHSRFPLVGPHRAGCRRCHPDAGNFKSITCYGCHEHTPSRIAAVHLDRGIRNYGNCIRCHRGASKGDGVHDDGRRHEHHGERGVDGKHRDGHRGRLPATGYAE